MNNSINEMDRSINFLALELPETIWEDVNKKWENLKSDISNASDSCKKIIHGHETDVLKEKLACSEMAAIAKEALKSLMI